MLSIILETFPCKSYKNIHFAQGKYYFNSSTSVENINNFSIYKSTKSYLDWWLNPLTPKSD